MCVALLEKLLGWGLSSNGTGSYVKAKMPTEQPFQETLLRLNETCQLVSKSFVQRS